MTGICFTSLNWHKSNLSYEDRIRKEDLSYRLRRYNRLMGLNINNEPLLGKSAMGSYYIEIDQR